MLASAKQMQPISSGGELASRTTQSSTRKKESTYHAKFSGLKAGWQDTVHCT